MSVAEIKRLEPRSVNDLLGKPEMRIDLLFDMGVGSHDEDRRLAREFYRGFADKPLDILSRTGELGREYIISAPQLRGEGIIKLLHIASKYKTYGFDTHDVIEDEHKLFHPTNEHEETRLANHRAMPGWEHFEREKDLLLNSIQQDYARSNRDHEKPYQSSEFLVPVARWIGGENPRWLFDPLDPQTKDLVLEPSQVGRFRASEYSYTLGLALIAAFSPEVTLGAKWGPNQYYDDQEKGQFMGTVRQWDWFLKDQLIYINLF